MIVSVKIQLSSVLSNICNVKMFKMVTPLFINKLSFNSKMNYHGSAPKISLTDLDRVPFHYHYYHCVNLKMEESVPKIVFMKKKKLIDICRTNRLFTLFLATSFIYFDQKNYPPCYYTQPYQLRVNAHGGR